MSGQAPTLAGGDAELDRLAAHIARFRIPQLVSADRLPNVERFSGVTLRADAVGFTQLTDQMMALGAAAVEGLANLIHDGVRYIAEIAEANGGELAHFAGDAAMLIWLIEERSNPADVIMLAVQTALDVHRQARAWRVGGQHLRFRISIGFGTIDHFEIGGRQDEWHCVVAGPSLQEAVVLGMSAWPDQTLVSAASWAIIRDRCRGEVLPGGHASVEQVVKRQDSPTPLPLPPLGSPPLPILRASVPRTTLEHLLTATPGEPSGEFRTLAVVFIHLSEPAFARPEHALAELHEAAQRIQAGVSRRDGSVHQIRADEDGITAIAVFGLPPRQHEDDASRAVELALALQRELPQSGFTVASGIATGRLFCAECGSDRRRVLVLVGPAVNLAARLMQTQAGAVCDAATIQAGRRHGRFAGRELMPRFLKGKAEPVVGYAPHPLPSAERLARPSESVLSGRSAELALLADAIEDLTSGIGGTILITGEAGLGKTALTRTAVEAAAARGVRCLVALGDEIEKETPFHSFEAVLRELFDERRPAAGDRQDTLIGGMGLGSLLSSSASDPLDRFSGAGAATGEARDTTTRRIIIDRFQQEAGKRGILLVLDDIHWFDSRSAALVLDLAEAQLPILALATTRPGDASELPALLLRAPGVRHCLLEALDQAGTAAVTARVLGAKRATDEVGALVFRRTGGNPFFTEEVAPLLRDTGVLSVIDGEVRSEALPSLAGAELDDYLRKAGVPGSLEGVINARLDRLTGRQRLLLRAAAVLGGSFSAGDLAAVAATDPASVDTDLAGLAHADFLVPSETSGRFDLKHSVLRDVIYHPISFHLRQQLHGRAARLIEADPALGGGGRDALLGHHHAEANERQQARAFLLRAGRKALLAHAAPEALSLLTKAAALGQAGIDGGTTPTVAVSGRGDGELELLLGEANLTLSRYPETRQHVERGLALLGFPIPRSTAGLAAALLRQVAVQVLRRRLPFAFPRRPRQSVDEIVRAARAVEGLVETYFYLGNSLGALYAALRSLNLAEWTGISAEWVRGQAILGSIAGFARMRGIARSYGERALKQLPALNDPAAAWWVQIVVGVTRLSTGDFGAATALFEQAEALTRQHGDRRRWRDAVENLGIIAAIAGDWDTALARISEYRESAERDKDQRYRVAAYREQAFCLLRSGQLIEAERSLHLVAMELGKGVKAEEAPTRQDYHAMLGALALAKGDETSALEHAAAALAVMKQASGSTSFPNLYWSSFIVAQLYLQFLAQALAAGTGDAAAHRKAVMAACKALAAQAAVHPIAVPSARLASGAWAVLERRERKARKAFGDALAWASRLNMPVEQALAQQLLALVGERQPSISAIAPVFGPMRVEKGGTAAV